jgi:hypothetical protein
MLCRHSLASLDDAVKTILGEPNESLPVKRRMKFDKGKTKARYGADGPDSSTCGSGCQA